MCQCGRGAAPLHALGAEYIRRRQWPVETLVNDVACGATALTHYSQHAAVAARTDRGGSLAVNAAVSIHVQI